MINSCTELVRGKNHEFDEIIFLFEVHSVTKSLEDCVLTVIVEYS